MKMQEFYEDIKNLNESNYQEFIQEYGLIVDEEIAKEALCITSNAWLVLSEELKMKDDIIMFYQPNGYFAEGSLDSFSNYDEYNSYTIFTSIPGFRAEHPNDYFSDNSIDETQLVQSIDRLQRPVINYPDNFNFELYFQIQRSLSEEKSYTIGELEKSATMRKLIPEQYIDGGNTSSTLYYIYRRNNLYQIVETLKPEYSGIARQKH